MRIIKHNEYELKPVKMLCDYKLHNKIDETELGKSFLNKSHFSLVIGKPASGKTSLAVSIINQLYKRVFDRVLLVMPHNSVASLACNPFADLPENQHFDELNMESVNEIYEQLLEQSADNCNTLLVLDDVQSALKLKQVLLAFKKIVANRRHLRCTIICCLQNYNALDKSLRQLSSNIICFNIGNVQFETVREEHLDITDKEFKKLRKFVFTEPHVWLFINPDSGRIFKKFDEIEYKSGTDDD